MVTNVVDLSSRSFVQNRIERFRNVLHKDETARVITRPVNAQWHVAIETANEFGNEFLRILMRPIHIVP